MAKVFLLAPKKSKLKVGLLGGSFNPPHAGHLYISKEVMKRFGLDLVIWLISPQNPLKKGTVYLPLNERVKLSKQLVKGHKIQVSSIERFFKSNYTYCSLKRITQMHPETQFILIMGSDNMIQFTSWFRWEGISQMAPIIIVERGNNIFKALKGKFASRFKNGQIITTTYKDPLKPSHWYVLRIKKNDLSSTRIRRGTV